VEGGTKGIANGELHDTGDELRGAAEEDGEAEDSLVRTDAPKRIGAGQTNTALVEAENESGDAEADEAQWTRIGNFAYPRIVDLGDGGLVRVRKRRRSTPGAFEVRISIISRVVRRNLRYVMLAVFPIGGSGRGRHVWIVRQWWLDTRGFSRHSSESDGDRVLLLQTSLNLQYPLSFI
jgi:hypothetical protein